MKEETKKEMVKQGSDAIKKVIDNVPNPYIDMVGPLKEPVKKAGTKLGESVSKLIDKIVDLFY